MENHVTGSFYSRSIAIFRNGMLRFVVAKNNIQGGDVPKKINSALPTVEIQIKFSLRREE